MKLKVVALVVAFVGATGWVGWTYRETFAQDPGMIGIAAVCGLIGLVSGVGQLMGWKARAEQARDLLDP